MNYAQKIIFIRIVTNHTKEGSENELSALRFLAFIQPDLAVVPKATSLQSRQTAVAFFKSTVLKENAVGIKLKSAEFQAAFRLPVEMTKYIF